MGRSKADKGNPAGMASSRWHGYPACKDNLAAWAKGKPTDKGNPTTRGNPAGEGNLAGKANSAGKGNPAGKSKLLPVDKDRVQCRQDKNLIL